MPVLAFRCPILLMSMRARNSMRYPQLLEEEIEFFIFSTPVSLHGYYFSIEFSLYKILKVLEHLEHIRLVF
jgi:hypothetical protein